MRVIAHIFYKAIGLRHAVRTLKFAGISQTDWHGGQVLCPKLRDGSRRIVLIDFAFAETWLGDEGGIPSTDDFHEARRLLKSFCSKDMLDRLWTPPLEMEY